MLASTVTFWRWLSGQPIPLDMLTAPSNSADERRVWVRYAANLNIRCEEISGEVETGVSAKICDLSRGGVRMISPRRFDPGTVLSVELPASQGQSALAVLACVIRAHPHGDDEWIMGCRFSGELNDEQLQSFGATRSRPDTPDPRGWSRFPCDAKAVFYSVNADDRASSTGRVRDLSAAGMALQVDEEVAAGELLNIELHDANGQATITILACVVHVQEVAEGWVLGCNFIRELDDKDLQSLL